MELQHYRMSRIAANGIEQGPPKNLHPIFVNATEGKLLLELLPNFLVT